MTIEFSIRTIKLKVRPEAYSWLNKAAIEVNQVWNWANEVSYSAWSRSDNKRKWLSGFDLNNLSAGATEYFDKIGAETIQRIGGEYAAKRNFTRLAKLRWRTSCGSKKSLGWVPFKKSTIKRNGNAFRFSGKTFRIFEANKTEGLKWRQGCFSQDSIGDWWLCLAVDKPIEQSPAPNESIGIDLGIKTIATTSDGDVLEAGRWTNVYSAKLANAQRRKHRMRIKRIHRKIARCRKDALHKFSRKIVNQYQNIVIGDVSSSKLVKTRMAKAVLDSGWSMLKTQLQYKGQQAGRSVQVVNESYTSVTCSSCGSRSGPKGVNGLIVRSWICSECGSSHDRDVNAAKNILAVWRYPHPFAEKSMESISIGGE